MATKELFDSTSSAAEQLADLLKDLRMRIVFAESCTAGLASASLAQFSGISDWLCGSAATYRIPVKQSWLDIDPDMIESVSAVSPQVTKSMAIRVLARTADADFSVGITGHLETDETPAGSLVYVCIAFRRDGKIFASEPMLFKLSEKTRCQRQWEATRCALEAAAKSLKTGFRDNSNSYSDADALAETDQPAPVSIDTNNKAIRG